MLPQDRSGVTVVLSGGWELPNMTIRWSDPEKGLWVVRSDGARRLYTPQELSSLHDANGQDITRDVIPAWALAQMGITYQPVQPQPTPQPMPPPQQTQQYDELGHNPQPKVEQPQDRTAWRFLIGADAGYTKGRNEDFGDTEGGPSLNALVRLQLAGPLYLAGGYSWSNLGRCESFCAPMPGMDNGDYYYGGDVEVQGYWGGLSLIPEGRNADSARFYLEAGVGRYQVTGLAIDSDESEFVGYNYALGFIIPLATSLAMDLGVTGRQIVDMPTYDDQSRHSMFGFHLGFYLLAR